MEVQHLDLGGNAGAGLDAAYARALGTPGASSAQGTGSDALTQSEQWIVQLERADAVVIATPMHNFTLPATLKNWIDHVVRIGRTFRATPEGKVGMLADRPVFVAIASGGTFSGSGQRQPGNAVVDIFRLAHGKVVEHWDVTQALSPNSANPNGML